MKRYFPLFILLFCTVSLHANEPSKPLNMVCEDYSWSDVEQLAQPYLDDVLQTALVMQGQSSDYKVSEAASFAMDKSMPDVVKRILQALIDADC